MSVYDRISGKQPDAAPHVSAIQESANAKLYSDLVNAFFALFAVLKDGALMVEVFEKDLVPEASKVNPLRFMELVGIILTKTGDQVFKTAEERLAFLKKMYVPFMTDEDKEAEEAANAKGDVEMKDADGAKKDDKPKPVSRAAAIGNKSHYTRAAEKDFRDCKAMMMGLKVELLVALGEDAANKSRASGSGLGGFMGSMTGGLLGGGGSASASDAKTESDNRLDEAKDLIEELTRELFQNRMIADIPPKVFSYYHFAQMRLFAALTDASAYYQAAVNYVRFTPNEEIAERHSIEELAVNIGIATLVAPGEYNFGEALELPIWDVEGLKNLWMYELLYSFREGKYEYYDACQKKHQTTIKKSKQLVDAEAMIYEKFCCCVLMEFAFQQPKNKRRLEISELKKIIRVEDVEKLLINAMCADLIKGSMDGVEGTFAYTWVKPRYLDASRLQVLQERVAGWTDQVQAVLSQVEELTPELLVSV